MGRVRCVAAGVIVAAALLASGCGPSGRALNDEFELRVVVPTSLTVSPTNPTIMIGATQQFSVIVGMSDGTVRAPLATDHLTWSSGTTATATIDPLTGLATGRSMGTTTITATLANVTGNTQLNVSSCHCLDMLQITPGSATVAVDGTLQLTAIGHYMDGQTSDVTAMAMWQSTDPNAASVDAMALVTAHAPGTVLISAHIGTIASNASTVTVTAP